MIHSFLVRLASMGAKFGFLILAARYLAAEDVATFGAMSAFVLMLIYFLGLDLHIATSRVISRDRKDFNTLLSNQVIAGAAAYALFLAAMPLFGNPVPNVSLAVLSLLVLTEFVSQELYKLQISHGDYVKANSLFFLKSGFWAILSAGLILVGLLTDISEIILLWIAATLLACLYGWRTVQPYLRDFKFSPDLGRFALDLRTNALVLSSSAALVVLGNADKVFLGAYAEHEELAAYFFFASLTGMISTLIYTGAINPNYARLVQAKSSTAQAFAVVRRISLSAFLIFASVSVGLVVLLRPLLFLVGQDYLLQSVGLFTLFMVTVGLSTLGFPPHFLLLAHEKDKQIAIASIAAVVAHLVTLPLFYGAFGVAGCAYSVGVGLATMVSLKTVFCLPLVMARR